jgi:hypothetical protein
MATTTTTDILPPRYSEIETVAHGGMGEIYRARDDALQRAVAVKVLADRFALDAELRARFRREALAAARLSGEPHIVTIYDVGEWNGRPFIVMELVAGGTIADRARRARTNDILRWLEQAGSGLDAAHARGVVHRDVKPANLLVGVDGNLRVADFGIASAAGMTSVTASGTVLGTIGYLAPEQALGRDVGPAADRYALAVVAYELLAGRRPYERANGTAEMTAATHEPVPPISGPDLPTTLDPIFERALAKEPSARYASCAEFVRELREAFTKAAGATDAWGAPQPRVVEPQRRGRVLPALLAAVLLGLAGVVAALVYDRTDDSTRVAQTATTAATTTTRAATTTAPAATPAAPAATATPPPAGSSSAAALNDQAWSRMQRGDYQGALPLVEQAVARASGSGSLTEAYALYNLAATRFALGSCDGVVAALDRSEAIQGHRAEIDRLRRDATARC